MKYFLKRNCTKSSTTTTSERSFPSSKRCWATVSTWETNWRRKWRLGIIQALLAKFLLVLLLFLRFTLPISPPTLIALIASTSWSLRSRSLVIGLKRLKKTLSSRKRNSKSKSCWFNLFKGLFFYYLYKYFFLHFIFFIFLLFY